MDDVDSEKILRFVLNQYTKFEEYTRALVIAMQLNDNLEIKKLFDTCTDM